MKGTRNRHVTLESTLVYVDEPQLITLKSGKTRFVGIAIPPREPSAYEFLVTSVSDFNWRRYLANQSDLRYLFTHATPRILYTLNLSDNKGDKFVIRPLDKNPPESWLPEQFFFEESHTHSVSSEDISSDHAELYIDGGWEMPELGRFQSRYSDIYSLIAAVKAWSDSKTPDADRRKVAEAFRTKPFMGGSSYGNFYSDLENVVPYRDRVRLESISYASPGNLKISGRGDVFNEIKSLINVHLKTEADVLPKYRAMHDYLSKGGYLRLAGEKFANSDPWAKKIRFDAEDLYRSMGLTDFDNILKLSNQNYLVAAKITLSIFRRIRIASTFFAQGRMSFWENVS